MHDSFNRYCRHLHKIGLEYRALYDTEYDPRAFRWLDTIGSAKYLDMAQQYQHLGPLYEVPAGLRDKARHNEAYYPQVEPARPVGALKTA